jgi:hypothetical protein
MDPDEVDDTPEPEPSWANRIRLHIDGIPEVSE